LASRDEVQRSLRAAAARMPELFAPGSRLVVGFSGGQDSTCLLHALSHASLKLEVLAAHVDHRLRADSAQAARQVETAAKSLGLPVETMRVDVAAYRATLPGWSVQQAARAARYQALATIAHNAHAAAVLVAHTADDQAETFLINLLRGAGLAGLAGMRTDERIHPARFGPRLAELDSLPEYVRLARPLLRVSRSTTLAYCTEFGLDVIEDPSNQSRAYTRNRVRLDLLPALENFNPAVRAILARTADLAAEDVAALDALVADLHERLATSPGADALEYARSAWRAQPRALQRRLLRRGIESLVGELVDVRAAPIDDALDLLQSGLPEQTYHLPHGIELCLGPSSFLLRLHGGARPRTPPKSWGRAHHAWTPSGSGIVSFISSSWLRSLRSSSRSCSKVEPRMSSR
jgi:tRNA(Ile)-lysidine synthetase-like protein